MNNDPCPFDVCGSDTRDICEEVTPCPYRKPRFTQTLRYWLDYCAGTTLDLDYMMYEAGYTDVGNNNPDQTSLRLQATGYWYLAHAIMQIAEATGKWAEVTKSITGGWHDEWQQVCNPNQLHI